MKKRSIIIFILSLTIIILVLILALKKDNDNLSDIDKDIETQKNNLQNEVNEIITVIENSNVKDSNNIIFMFGPNYLYGLKQSDNSNRYDYVVDKKLESIEYVVGGKAIQKNDGSLYVSAWNDEYCVIKDFNDNNLSVYEIKEKTKCYKTYVDGEELTLYIKAINLDNATTYESGSVGKSNLLLVAVCNVLDSNALTYKWYKDGSLINNYDDEQYYVVDNEDSEYVVEVTTNDGQTILSETFHVIIEKDEIS